MSTGEQQAQATTQAAEADRAAVSLLDQVIARDQADRAVARPRT